MKAWLHKVEYWVDKLIPYSLVLLLVVIILELFFTDFVHHNHLEGTLANIDAGIILLFLMDLYFKWIRIRKIPKFLRRCWLDIIAVFPFILFFRLLEEVINIARFGDIFKKVQSVLHETVEVEKEVTKIAQSAEKMGKASRVRIFTNFFTKYSRFVRPIARTPRFIKALTFFERPTGKHHPHDKEYPSQMKRKPRKKAPKKKKR